MPLSLYILITYSATSRGWGNASSVQFRARGIWPTPCQQLPSLLTPESWSNAKRTKGQKSRCPPSEEDKPPKVLEHLIKICKKKGTQCGPYITRIILWTIVSIVSGISEFLHVSYSTFLRLASQEEWCIHARSWRIIHRTPGFRLDREAKSFTKESR